MRFLSLLCLLLALSGCFEDKPAKAQQQGEALSTQQKTVGNPIAPTCEEGVFPAVQLVDRSAPGYAEICPLEKISGLQIDGSSSIYLCRTQLFEAATHPSQKKVSAKKLRAVLGEAAERADILTRYGLAGKQFGVLVIYRGGETQILATQAELQQARVTVETPDAALAWAYLYGALGSGPAEGFNAKALCGARLEATAEGWKLKNASIFKNCEPDQTRDLLITRDGSVEILSLQVVKGKPVLCVD